MLYQDVRGKGGDRQNVDRLFDTKTEYGEVIMTPIVIPDLRTGLREKIGVKLLLYTLLKVL